MHGTFVIGINNIGIGIGIGIGIDITITVSANINHLYLISRDDSSCCNNS